jgi:heparan-alpha-glucosaminide N-acetyltransferase
MQPNQRLVSLDAFRGFVMLLMASSGLGLAQMAGLYPDSWWWQQIKYQVSHVPWTGCSLWDLIQPSFMFMVGIAVPLSVTRRKEAGQGIIGLTWHSLMRALSLVLLAVLLSTGSKEKQTLWIFTNVLAQIGLGYVFLSILARLGWEYCVAAMVMILGGYWFWFFQHPLPEEGFDYAAIGAMKEDLLPGFFGHWSKGLNAAADFDRWLLNLLPHAQPFITNAGGYTTLNFIPALATMLGGAITGNFLLNSPRSQLQKCGMLLVVAAVALLVGTVVGFVGCPIVKRIWTPSWVLFSGGLVLVMLTGFYWLIEIVGLKKPFFPLVIVGMNSIFIYVMHSLTAGWIGLQLSKHGMADLFTTTWGPVIEKASVLAVLWLLCFWLYRQRAFLRL